MKLKLVFLALFFLSLNSLMAQDQLFKKDNTKHEVKVLEITPTEIKYKLQSNPNGPLYVINKSDVALIIYANGSHETYADTKPSQQQTFIVQSSPFARYDSLRAQRKRANEKKYIEVTKNKNVVFVNTLGLVNSCVSLSYLREFGKGLFSIQVPVSFSFSEPTVSNSIYPTNIGFYGVNGFKIEQKSIDAGIGIYFHTSGRKAVTHFIGPMFRFAQYNGTFYAAEFANNQYGYPITIGPYKKHGFVMNESYLLMNNGILFRIIPNLNLMINAAIGYTASRRFIANDPAGFYPQGYYSSSNNLLSSPVFHLGFSAGYRF